MDEKTQKIPYFVLPAKRDILDLMDSYRYMNSPLISEVFAEGIWDHGAGWVHLHYSSWDWRTRSAQEPRPPFPESTFF